MIRKSSKVLYAIQGTGNGHVARAREIIPFLSKICDLDILLSGTQSNIDIGHSIKHQSRGLVFFYNKKGGLSYWQTIVKNNIFKLLVEIIKFPIKDYDLIINDFECISAWSAKIRGVKSISLGHQSSFVSDKVPRPKKKDFIGELILKFYAPCSSHIGFHFKPYDTNIYPAVIRSEVRNLNFYQSGHINVYLPAYRDPQIIEVLSKIDANWIVFSKYCTKEYMKANITFKPVSNLEFLKSFESCSGVLSSAGFEAPAESIFANKKLLCIPIKGQYEQYCNAAALKELGVPIINRLDIDQIPIIENWLSNTQTITLETPDFIEDLLRKIIQSNTDCD